MKELDLTVKLFFEQALKLMQEANVTFPVEATANIYHHTGKDNINEVGALFLNVVNKEYCKSYVVMLPGQKYPNHYHKIKSESYYVLHNDLIVNVNGEEQILHEGEMTHVDRGDDHFFYSKNGVVFEELSTMYVPNDSIYLEESIKKTSYSERRTTLNPDEWKEFINIWKK